LTLGLAHILKIHISSVSVQLNWMQSYCSTWYCAQPSCVVPAISAERSMKHLRQHDRTPRLLRSPFFTSTSMLLQLGVSSLAAVCCGPCVVQRLFRSKTLLLYNMRCFRLTQGEVRLVYRRIPEACVIRSFYRAREAHLVAFAHSQFPCMLAFSRPPFHKLTFLTWA